MGEGETRVRFLFIYSQIDGSPGFIKEILRQDLTTKALPGKAGSVQRPFRQQVALR